MSEHKTRDALLVFKREELLYDIKSICYLEGEMMSEDIETRHQIMDVADFGNENRVARVLNLAHSECIEMLYPYSKRMVAEQAVTDDLSAPQLYDIRLFLPETFSQTTLDVIHRLMHEYMVNSVVSDWLSITKPDSQITWESKKIMARDKIKTLLMSRINKVRRRLKPF